MTSFIRIRKALFLLVLMSFVIAGQLYAGDLEQAPYTSTIVLDDGTEVGAPVYSNARGYIVMGTADLDALYALQNGVTSHEPINVLGKGVAAIMVMEYFSNSDLGVYKEVAFSHMVMEPGTVENFTIDWNDPNGFAGVLEELMSKCGLFYDGIWLNSDLGVAAGEQIWGMPKKEADIWDYTAYLLGSEYMYFDDSATGKTVVDMKLPLIYHHPFNLPAVSIKGVTAGDWSGNNEGKVWDITMKAGPTGIKLYNAFTNRIYIGSGTEEIALIKEMNFQPLMVAHFSDMEFLSDAPTE